MNTSPAIGPELIERALAGGNADVDRLIAAVWPHAYRIAYAVLRERSLAEDAAQESCAILIEKIATLRKAASFDAWFYRIVYREALRLHGRHNSQLRGHALETNADGPERSLMRMDVSYALSQLTPVQRTAIALNVYAGMTTAEISHILGLPHSTVRSHIFRGKQKLEEILRGYGPTTRAMREAIAGA